jgi:hypothetical protein
MNIFFRRLDSYINNNEFVLIFFTLVLCFLSIILGGENILTDADTYWHIATGRWILDNGSIPITDPFSHTMRWVPWHAHEWASAVFLAVSYQVGGWYGVVVLTVISASLSLILLAKTLSMHLRGFYVSVFIILAFIMMKGHLLARPHILVLPIIVIWVTLILEARENGKRPPLLSVLLIVLWANMHGSFLIGIFITGVMAVEAFFAAGTASQRRKVFQDWGLFLSIVFFSSMLTPYGFRGIIFPFEILKLKVVLSVIKEWQPPDFRGFSPIGVWIFFVLGSVLYRGLHIPFFRILLILILLYLTLTHQRSAEYLGFVVPILVVYSISAQWPDARAKVSIDADHLKSSLSLFCGLVGILALLFLWVRDVAPAAKISPERALQAARQAGVTGNVLNDYNFGGFLIFNDIPVFIDGRADMYGDAFIERFIRAVFQAAKGVKSKSEFSEILTEYQINWAISEPNGMLSISFKNLSDWKELYRDDSAIVYIRIDQ